MNARVVGGKINPEGKTTPKQASGLTIKEGCEIGGLFN